MDEAIFAAYLAWTERAMTEQPERLRAMSACEFDLAEAMVVGVRVELDRDRLPDEFDLP